MNMFEFLYLSYKIFTRVFYKANEYSDLKYLQLNLGRAPEEEQNFEWNYQPARLVLDRDNFNNNTRLLWNVKTMIKWQRKKKQEQSKKH